MRLISTKESASFELGEMFACGAGKFFDQGLLVALVARLERYGRHDDKDALFAAVMAARGPDFRPSGEGMNE